MTALRVVIVDDHPMFRIGLAAAVEEMPGIELVGEAQRVDEVAALVADTAPDVLVLDLGLPDGSGLEVVRWVAKHCPHVRVMVLTMSEDPDTALLALADGASGYLIKGAEPERLECALRSVAVGDIVLDRAIVPAVTELAPARRLAPARAFPELTNREFGILSLVAKPCNNTDIARALNLSPKTVRNYVSTILEKLHVHNRTEAIVLARRHGLGE